MDFEFCVHELPDLIQLYHNLNCGCPTTVSRVCGSNGQFYDNSCLLDCTRKFASGKFQNNNFLGNGIYSNKCFVDGKRLTQMTYEFCENKHKEPEDRCVCPRDYDPVCRSDGKIYENECLMKCAEKLCP